MRLVQGDCLDVLKTLEDNSIDSLVTDPPAGIAFMGKEWDKDKGGRKEWVAWMESVMRECLRVMKPGAHGLVWALPRTSHWTASALEDAGFEIRDCITHLFGSGFPKSLDISKAIDKAAGAERDIVATIKKTPSASSENMNEGWKRPWAEDHPKTMDITAPATDAAKQWQGFGTALKPASEHWILVRKPLSEKTVAANVLKWGCGGLNIDGSRIGSNSMPKPCTNNNIKGNAYASDTSDKVRDTVYNPNQQGRFPANLVLSHSEHCTDTQCDIECAVQMLDVQGAGYGRSNGNKTNDKSGHQTDYIGGELRNKVSGPCYSDKGSVSRFFYCAKVSTSERNAGLEGMEKKFTPTMNGGIGGREHNPDEPSAYKQNHHPTVKPQKLMRYLIKLVTPPQGAVLDPFMGSGSTGLAAKSEGFGFVGIEREPEYYEIASKRCGIEDSVTDNISSMIK